MNSDVYGLVKAVELYDCSVRPKHVVQFEITWFYLCWFVTGELLYPYVYILPQKEAWKRERLPKLQEQFVQRYTVTCYTKI